MTIVQNAIKYPVTTAVGVMLLTLFGAIALFRIPVQLTPTVEDPEVTVITRWPGASPHEVEREIVDEQEEQLKSLEGLVEMESESREHEAQVTLRFLVGTNLDTAVLKVSNALEQVPSYPDDADKPIIRTVDVRANAVGWFLLAPTEEDGFQGDIATEYDFLDDFVKPEFERVEGVASSNIMAGREVEMHVIVDPAKLAARQVTFNQLGAALERENRNYGGGDFDEGKRRYLVRTVGEYASPGDIEDVVITVRNGVPIYIRDVGYAEIGYRKATAKGSFYGREIIAMNVVKEPGANLLDLMATLKQRLADINERLLKPRGLRLVQVYDESTYIHSSIELVQQSLVVGGCLANRGAVDLLAQLQQHARGRGGHSDQRHRHLSDDELLRSHAERHQPGRDGVRRRHGGRQLNRRSRKHLPPPANGKIALSGRLHGRVGGLGRRSRQHVDDHRRLLAGFVH